MKTLNKTCTNKRALKGLPMLYIATILVACSAGDEPLETNLPDFDAATLDPCAEQFEFQRELNGAPDDSVRDVAETQGKTVITEQYWYESSSMIVYFTYAKGESWCNVWNENGVTWTF